MLLQHSPTFIDGMEFGQGRSIRMTKFSKTIRLAIAGLVLCVGLLPLKVFAQNAPHRLSKDDLVYLLNHQVSPRRVSQRAREQGIDFEVTTEVETELRRAGATHELLTTLHELAPKPAQIVIQTSPNAQVYLDGVFNGQASPQGRLVIDNAKPGERSLRVTLAGEKAYDHQVTVVTGQTANVQATLADLAGSIRVQTSARAEVFLDTISRGTADAGAELILQDVSPGTHQLQVKAGGKKEFRQGVIVHAGEEASVEVRLENLAPTPREVHQNPKDGLNYVWIPPGKFTMGCSPGDRECSAEEKPAHQVTITKGFWMGQTDVTVAAYKKFAGSAAPQMPAAPSFNAGWNNQNMPIVNVSWDDATAFCGWAGGRLPTEAEWEYAARAGSIEARYGPIKEVAWYSNNSGQKTHAVGQKRANAFGLYDMLGNVWEWVNDWYGEHYFASSPERDPRGPNSGQYRVRRGGSWNVVPRGVRVSDRIRDYPASRYFSVGLRCARELDIP
jgi:formylglycine-generating enzyme required for sulfatase activity